VYRPHICVSWSGCCHFGAKSTFGQIRKTLFTGKKVPAGHTVTMAQEAVDDSPEHFIAPNAAAMVAANVNPDTGLATDYLNLFNEYIMLAEMVADQSLERDVLDYWQPFDYETHFAQSGFAGSDVILAAYRTIPHDTKLEFEEAVMDLISLILTHQGCTEASCNDVTEMKLKRDHIATMISDPVHATDTHSEETQADIDALFD
jgi:hypothetical protein